MVRKLKIGLWSDSHNFPDLCLMKISAYCKTKGDQVEFIRPGGIYGTVFLVKFSLNQKNLILILNMKENFQAVAAII